MNTLITGCAGFIGSHLTESLLADGHKVVGVDCFNDNYGRADKLRNLERSRDWDAFDFVPVDLSRGELDDLVDGCDVVFHLAAEPGVRHSWGQRFDSYLRNNVLATQHLLAAVNDHPGPRFVYASSSSVYGQAEHFPTQEDATPAPLSPYGATKLMAEHLCGIYNANHGVPTVALRYFSVYGPRQRPDMAFNIFCRALLENRPIQLFGGDQSRDFTFVEDVVRATRVAAEIDGIEGRVFNIGGGTQIPLAGAVDLLAEVTGTEPEVQRIGVQHGDARDTSADITRARGALGYEPRVHLREGLLAEWEWVASSLTTR
jgi:UDP-glucuronate 4-epimerase